jgi:hypothetical protein
MIKEDQKEVISSGEGPIITHPLVHSIQVDSKVRMYWIDQAVLNNWPITVAARSKA